MPSGLFHNVSLGNFGSADSDIERSVWKEKQMWKFGGIESELRAVGGFGGVICALDFFVDRIFYYFPCSFV